MGDRTGGSCAVESFSSGTLQHRRCGNGRIAGFGDIDETGYLDRLYVRADMQGEGVATAICDRLESIVEGTIVTHASITAKPFFEKRGYAIVREQQVERRGILLTNYVMELRRKEAP